MPHSVDLHEISPKGYQMSMESWIWKNEKVLELEGRMMGWWMARVVITLVRRSNHAGVMNQEGADESKCLGEYWHMPHVVCQQKLWACIITNLNVQNIGLRHTLLYNKVCNHKNCTCSCIKTVNNFCTRTQVRPAEFIEFGPTLTQNKHILNSTAKENFPQIKLNNKK